MKIRNLLLIALLFIGLSSCQKDDSDEQNSAIENSPSAVSSTNNSSAGVYKGVLVGSSGYFKISIANGADTIFCDFKFDDKIAHLTSTSFANWTPGQPISNAVFTGTWNGQTVTLTFSCDANGANPTVTVNVPGHTVNVSLYKETSTTLVKCYEGSYVIHRQSGNITGTWNFVVYGSLMVGYHHDSESEGIITGTLSGTVLTIDQSQLTVTNTEVSGSFHDGDGNLITVTGKRTL